MVHWWVPVHCGRLQGFVAAQTLAADTASPTTLFIHSLISTYYVLASKEDQLSRVLFFSPFLCCNLAHWVVIIPQEI